MFHRTLITITVAFAVLATTPVFAGGPSKSAWDTIQKVNEMAADLRDLCESGDAEACSEAAIVAGDSFAILNHAKRCMTGDYPRACQGLGTMIAVIDRRYDRYITEAGPERVAHNRTKVRAMTCESIPTTGTCPSAEAVVEARLVQSE